MVWSSWWRWAKNRSRNKNRHSYVDIKRLRHGFSARAWVFRKYLMDLKTEICAHTGRQHDINGMPYIYIYIHTRHTMTTAANIEIHSRLRFECFLLTSDFFCNVKCFRAWQTDILECSRQNGYLIPILMGICYEISIRSDSIMKFMLYLYTSYV